MTVLRLSWVADFNGTDANKDNERHNKLPLNRAIRVSFMRLWRLTDCKEKH